MSSKDSVAHKPARRQKRGNAAIGNRLRRPMLLIGVLGFVYFVYSWAHVGEAARLEWQPEKAGQRVWYNRVESGLDSSPPYRDYALRRHGPYSEGTAGERKITYL